MAFTLFEAVIWSLVIVLAIIIIILVFYLKILRRNIRVTEKRNKKYKKTIEELLIQFIYAEEEGVKFSKEQKDIIKKFRKGLVSKRKRKIITDTFLKLDQEVAGHMIEQMNMLYKEIGLLNFAIKKLRSKNWHIVAIGIKDLRQFKVRRVKKAIAKLINHEREEVRREAHLYFIELFGFEGLDFLHDLKVPLSEWDQILLLGEAENLENHEIVDVIEWLKSENDYVVLFVLNIVQVFNRLETKNFLLKLLYHKNEKVRLKTIETISHFEIYEAKKILKEKFNKLTVKEKIAFFNLLEKTATSDDGMFLLNHVTDEEFEIKHKSLQILKNVNLDLYSKLEKVSEDKEYNRIVKFLDYNYGI